MTAFSPIEPPVAFSRRKGDLDTVHYCVKQEFLQVKRLDKMVDG
jgi:hypothetical protein